MLPFEDDPLCHENLLQDNWQHFCNIFNFANEIGPPVYPASIANLEERQNISNIVGLACDKNFTLHMLAVDSIRNHHFAEFLGVDITNKKDMTAVVILDSLVSSYVHYFKSLSLSTVSYVGTHHLTIVWCSGSRFSLQSQR